MFDPRLESLPEAPKAIWPELKDLPPGFVLYGGTALALRLGHRVSEDFDFFSQQPFERGALLPLLPAWNKVVLRKDQKNTLEIALATPLGPVRIAFFGGLNQKRVGNPDRQANRVWVASLMDLAGSKMLTIQQRAMAKDYLDVWACINAGVSLEQMLSAAWGIFGMKFQPMISLKALSCFTDGDLKSSPENLKSGLVKAAGSVRLDALFPMAVLPGTLIP